ncbi:autotransporter assembly complex protein TamA [Limnobacter litoralis]|uniref:Outer membrane protein assembly factor n=1 Tax=Limnobacter litoralis TaxID=481366 RepID=A0ABQ5YRR5_9BURK|nr:autotransporter assembly complex family protein [Limnobacter litoralis]GLR27333.1 outer membrane protein assembly factor [Limnobacter litoralis]
MRLLIGLICCLWTACAFAQASDIVRYKGDVPSGLKDLIQTATQPILQTARVDDEGDVWQLFRRLRPVIRDTLGTEGYFAPTINREVPTALPEGAPFKPELTIVLQTGPAFKVAGLDLKFEGDIQQPEFDARRRSLIDQWSLTQGKVFRQADWSADKDAILRQLLAKDFADATISESLADVDPETQSVYLHVVYDSGPVFTFGQLQVTGLKRYKKELVERYNTIRPGDRYEQERLLTLLSDLQNTSYFSSVDVKINRDAENPIEVPIEVTLAESKAKRLGLGAGYSSNTGFRTEASYQFNDLFNRAYSLLSGVRLEQKRQSAYTDLFFPPTRRGVVDSLGVAVDHQNLTDLDIQRTSLGALREYTLGVTNIRLGLNYQLEHRTTPLLDLGNTKALVASASWNKSMVDDRLNPSKGYVLFAQTAVASRRVLSDQDFFKINGRVQKFWSPTRKDLFSARFELGTVVAGSAQDIPQDYLFRAGGTNSIRGFKFQDVGVYDNGVLVGGRRIAVGSLEYTRWLRGPFGASVFTDFGDVANTWGELKPVPAIGFGARYRTPAGPIALDVAKAQGQKNIRIHFALGVAF